MTTYGRYVSCSTCEKPIMKESDGFTCGNGTFMCQNCGLEDMLTPREWSTIFRTQRGDNIGDLRRQCPSLRCYPPTKKSDTSIVEFSSPTTGKYCIVR